VVGRLLVYDYRSAGRDLRFQFFNLNRFGPNNSKVLFHAASPPKLPWSGVYSSTITDPLGAIFASSSSISIVSVQITPKFSFMVLLLQSCVSFSALLVYNHGSARRHFRFQFFNLDGFGPNDSKVLFHCSFPLFKNLMPKKQNGLREGR
jgi:hypothetical protein